VSVSESWVVHWCTTRVVHSEGEDGVTDYAATPAATVATASTFSFSMVQCFKNVHRRDEGYCTMRAPLSHIPNLS
jgi:hypothetical protein